MSTRPADIRPHPDRCRGKRILLTGAASGIGLATAERLAAEGASLALLDRAAEALDAVCKRLGAVAQVVDLARPEEIGPAIEAAARALGGLDAVVHCAGVQHGALLSDLEPSDWSRMIAVNLTAPYLISRAALPWLRECGNGAIVTVASGQALMPNAKGASGYAASKAGVLAFTKSLAAELAPHIRANVVCPGAIDTPMLEEVLGRKDASAFMAQYPLQRAGRPEEVAAAIAFLVSDEAAYITGVALAVDGGRTFH